MGIADLDPNFVLVVDYSRENLSVLLAELGAKGVRCECRPSHELGSVYVFLNDDSGKVVKFVEKFDFVKKVSALYTGKERDQVRRLATELIKKRSMPKDSDLIQLADTTHNPRVALYFAFAKTYTRFLMPLALFGLGLRMYNPQGTEFNTTYAVVVLTWAVAFIVLWKNRYEPRYASRFGYLSLIPFDDSRTTFIKKLCFIPIAAVFVAILLTFQLFCFTVEIFFTQIYQGPLASVLALVPTLLISAFVPILTVIYNKVFVDRMTAWENGFNPTRSKVEKNFVLSFLTSYVPLLITLFIYFPFGYLLNSYLPMIDKYSTALRVPVDSSAFKVNLQRYQSQFFYFTVTNQVIAIGMENILPVVLSKVLPFVTGENKPTSVKSKISRLVSEEFPDENIFLSEVRQYETSPWGAFNVDDGMRKLVLQYGFVVVFSCIWPLAPLVCILFNMIFIKLDLWRALTKSAPLVDITSRKDVEKEDRYEDVKLSPWNSILTFLTWISSMITPALLLMYRYTNLPGVGYDSQLSKRSVSSSWYEYYPFHYDFKTIVLTTFLLEHAFLFVYYILSKTLQSPLSKIFKTFVPAEELREPPKLNLDDVVNSTARFMNTLSQSTGAPSSENGRTVAMKEPAIREDKTHNDLGKTSATNFDERNETHLTRRIPSSPLPAPGVQAPKQTSIASLPSKELTNGVQSSSASSLSSSVAGATLPPTIPTSKNFDIRKSASTTEAASVATLSSVPRATPKPNATEQKTTAAVATKLQNTNPIEEIPHPKVPKIEVNLSPGAQQFASLKTLEPENQFVGEEKVVATQPKHTVSETPIKSNKPSVKKDIDSVVSNSAVSGSKKKKKGIMSPLGKLKKKF